MLVDAFLFCNELDILEIRLNSLASEVDLFVLCESAVTFSGKPKPLVYMQNSGRFSMFPILHAVADDGTCEQAALKRGEAWGREYHQREILIRAAMDAMEPDDTLMLSDVDEMPDMESYSGGEGVFRQKMYCYWLNCYTGKSNWHGTIAMKKRSISSPVSLRQKRGRLPIVGSGWHFTYTGTDSDMIAKLESFSHSEYDTERCKEEILKNRERMVDPFGRFSRTFTIEDPSGPQWLLGNRHRYAGLFYQE